MPQKVPNNVKNRTRNKNTHASTIFERILSEVTLKLLAFEIMSWEDPKRQEEVRSQQAWSYFQSSKHIASR